MSFLAVCGWVGTFCLMICGVPQAIYSLINGNSNGVTRSFLILWGIGDVSMGWYTYKMYHDAFLTFNYSFCLITLFIISYYKAWPRS
jgi:hypothetical protein